MAWLCAVGSAGSTSGWLSQCPPIEPSCTSNGKPFASVSWRRGWQRGGFLTRLSGLTLPRSMVDRGVASWISSLAAIRASRSPAPEDAWAQATRDTFGRTSLGSWGRCSRPLPSLKTCSGTCRWDCARCAPTFATWATQFRRAPSARGSLGRRTSANACSSSPPAGGLWPTPQAHDAGRGNPSRVGRFGTQHGERNLNDEVALWPTPNTGGGGQRPPAGSRWVDRTTVYRPDGTKFAVGLATAVEKWPTPDRADDPQRGLLNPRWVCRMMGMLEGWSSPQ